MHDVAKGGLIERAVVESLDALAAPKVRNAIIALAMRWARTDRIPERGPEVALFINGALFAAAEQVLGQAAAESIDVQLAPLGEMVASSEISSVRPSRPAGPIDDDDFPEISVASPPELLRDPYARRPHFATDPAPAHDQVVLVASEDPSGVQEMSQALAGVASVEVVRDALDLLDELGRHDTSLVVVDCRRPVVSVETLLALGPELPSEARIVLWGERANLESDLSRLDSALPDTWVCCGPRASADDVGAVCRILLD